MAHWLDNTAFYVVQGCTFHEKQYFCIVSIYMHRRIKDIGLSIFKLLQSLTKAQLEKLPSSLIARSEPLV